MADIELKMVGDTLPAERVTLAKGDILTVELPNLYSGGYLWDASAGDGLDVRTLREPPPGDGERLVDLPVGSGPPVRITASPRFPGRHVLALRLRRPWEDAPHISTDLIVEATDG